MKPLNEAEKNIFFFHLPSILESGFSWLVYPFFFFFFLSSLLFYSAQSYKIIVASLLSGVFVWVGKAYTLNWFSTYGSSQRYLYPCAVFVGLKLEMWRCQTRDSEGQTNNAISWSITFIVVILIFHLPSRCHTCETVYFTKKEKPLSLSRKIFLICWW